MGNLLKLVCIFGFSFSKCIVVFVIFSSNSTVSFMHFLSYTPNVFWFDLFDLFLSW